MKNFKFVLCLVISFLPVWLWAKQVSLESAQQAAKIQVNSRNQLRSTQELHLAFVKTTDSKALSIAGKANGSAPACVLYYVFNIGERGFVIVSGDDIAQPILGYSDTGAFDSNNLPPNFAYYLNDCLAKEIEQAIVQGTPQSEKTKAQWEACLNENTSTLRASNAVVVAPLVLTKWDQGSPYSTLCPSGTVTGCVATAMAQIMKYWNYPETGVGSSSYTSSPYGVQSADFGNTTYDWGNMAYTYSASSTTQQKNAVSTLMYHCGVSVKMTYATAAAGGSSAYSIDVAYALVNYFKYDAGINYRLRDYYSYTEWVNIIKAELEENRPVLYSGQGSAGGHAFVCDGYDSNDLFHFNWGWSGSSDGYFELSALNPNSLGIGGGAGGFNTDQSIIVGIRPDAGGASVEGSQMGLSNIYPSSTSLSSISTLFNITVENLFNIGSNTLNLFLGTLLCNNDGTNITYRTYYNVTDGLDPEYGWNSLSFSSYKLPSDIKPGTYKLYCAYSTKDNPDTPIKVKGENGDKYIRIIIASDNTVTLSGESAAATLSLKSLATVGDLYQNKTGKFTATITNSGDGDYNSIMTISLNSTVIATDPVVIPAGTTKEVGFSGTISSSPGTYSLTLKYFPDQDSNQAPLTQLGDAQTVTVLATPPDPALSVTSLSFPDVNAVSASEPNLSARIKNTGGIFDGNIRVYITEANSSSIIGNLGTGSVSIKQGEEKTILFNEPVSLPEGTYDGYVFSNDGSNYSQIITGNWWVRFTLTRTATWTPQASSSDWNNSNNWKPVGIPGDIMKVIIPKSASYPVLTEATSVAEIHFQPGAQLGGQSYLSGKAFVSYDLSNRESWNMLSIPLKQVYPDDFTFGGYPQTRVCTFSSANEESSVVTGSWATLHSSDTPFTFGDGFVLWLNKDNNPNYPINATKGLKLLNDIRELPFFQHQAAGSPDKDLYDKVHQAHVYDAGTGKSTFFNVKMVSGQYERDETQQYSVTRQEANQLAGTSFSKPLDFTGDIYALLGNPYMATLDFAAFQNINSGIKKNYYVWTGNGYTIFTPNGATGATVDNSAAQFIAPLQGFLVEKQETSPNNITLSFSENVTTVNPNIHSPVNQGDKLNIVARNPVAEFGTFIAKREDGQESYGNMDARKIMNEISDVPEVYTLKPYKGGLVAVGANIIGNEDLLIPVGLATSYTGDITLSFKGMDTYNTEIHFIDAKTDEDIKLTGLASYDYVVANYTPEKVSGTAVACEDRFFIRISKNDTGIKDIVAGKANVYETEGLIRVISGASDMIKEVAVYDLQGVLMYKAAAVNAITHTINGNFSSGVYVVKVITEKNIDNVKLVVK